MNVTCSPIQFINPLLRFCSASLTVYSVTNFHEFLTVSPHISVTAVFSDTEHAVLTELFAFSKQVHEELCDEYGSDD